MWQQKQKNQQERRRRRTSKKKKKKHKERKRINNNNSNPVKHPGLIKDRVLKAITLSSDMVVQMTTEYEHFIRLTLGVIKNLKIIDDKVWNTLCPDKMRYEWKCVTKIKCEGKDNILKQRLVVTFL